MIRTGLKWIQYGFGIFNISAFLFITLDGSPVSAAGISVIPDKSLIIQIVNFIVLIWALNIVLYRPIRNVLLQRKEKMTGLHQRIDDFNHDIEEKDEVFDAGIKEARVTGLKEKEALILAAEEEEKSITSEINKKAKDDLAEVLAKISKETEEARKSLQKEIDGFVQEIGRKILGRTV